MVEANVRIINDLKVFLERVICDVEERARYSISGVDFSRKRCLPFSTLVLFILNLPKRSLSIELYSFFTYLGQITCTKSAFCQQRQKLKAVFFEHWNSVLVQSFYNHYQDSVKRWKGFVLLALDGSVFALPNTEELRSLYGNASSNRGEHGAVARSGILYDVLNNLVINGRLHPYLSSERSVVLELLEHMPKNSLLTFDRGYPSFWLFYLFLKNRQHKFVMRVHTGFNNTIKAFMRSAQQDSVLSFQPSYDAVRQMKEMGLEITKETSINLRLVKIILPTGEVEVLVTNLFESEAYSIDELKEVYALRWGIEVFYGTAKNQLQIECFSGIKQICIEQDYYANLFVYNLQSIVEKQSEPILEQINKKRILNYKINKNISWSALKNRVVLLFLTNNCSEVLLELQNLFQQQLEPVRPNRKFPRVRKAIHGNGKYRTLTNYKRAI